MKMYLGGGWIDKDDKIPVINPYDNSVVDTVPRAGLDDVEAALASAGSGCEGDGEGPRVPAVRDAS